MKQCRFYFDEVVLVTLVVSSCTLRNPSISKSISRTFFRSDKLIEGIEAWNDVAFLFQFACENMFKNINFRTLSVVFALK